MGRVAIGVLGLALAMGCARSHLVDETRRDPRDPDGPDASLDAGDDPDAGSDAGDDPLDAGGSRLTRWENEDDTRQCLDPIDIVLENAWPVMGETVAHQPSRTGITTTPLVLPPSVPGGAPRLVFTTHERGAVAETPHYSGRMRAERFGVLRVFDLGTRELHSSTEVERAMSQTATPAAGDVDGDGELEIVVLGGSAGLYIFDDEARLERFVRETPPRAPPLRDGNRFPISVSGTPTIADLEGDGRMEIIVGSCVIDGATGDRRFCGPLDEGHARHQYFGPISTVYDLDGDGELEILAGRTAFEPDGSVLWNSETRRGDDGFVAVGEMLPSHPGPEIAFVSESFVYVLDPANGRRLHVARLDAGVALGPPIGLRPAPAFQGGPPLLIDVDLDGNQEIGVIGSYGYYLIDPEDPHPLRSVRWRERIVDLSGMTASMGTDLTGDAYPEIVMQDERHIRVIDGRTGQTRYRNNSGSGTRTDYPVIADVDFDGSSEIIAGSAQGLRIFGERRSRFTRFDGPWLQHNGPNGDGARAVTSTGMGGLGASPTSRPDAWIAWAEVVCDADEAVLRIGVYNLGGEPLEYAGEIGLAVSNPAEQLAEGTFEVSLLPDREAVVTLPFTPREGTWDYYVAISSAEAECNTANNGLALSDLTCP